MRVSSCSMTWMMWRTSVRICLVRVRARRSEFVFLLVEVASEPVVFLGSIFAIGVRRVCVGT